MRINNGRTRLKIASETAVKTKAAPIDEKVSEEKVSKSKVKVKAHNNRSCR